MGSVAALGRFQFLTRIKRTSALSVPIICGTCGPSSHLFQRAWVFRWRRVAVACVLCASGNEAEFPVEMIIHFSGLWLFPKVLICLDCDFAQFKVPETELASLAVPRQVKDSREPCVDSARLPA
jgi:hypothetical protein